MCGRYRRTTREEELARIYRIPIPAQRDLPISYNIAPNQPVLAGLWDGWQNPGTKEWLRTCVIITGEPNELVAQIHNRMPIILPPETHEQWLSGEFGKEILRPFAAKEMTARPISKRINKPENNDPSVLEEGEIEQIGRLI